MVHTLTSATIPDQRKKPPGIQTLVRLAQTGQAEATEELVAYTRPLVFAYLYFYAGTAKTTGTLVELTFDTALKHIGQAPAYADPALWLLRIAREAAEDYFGGPFRLRIQQIAETGDEPSVSNARLLAAISTLSPQQQELVVLRHMLRLNDQEIAIITRSTQPATTAALRTAMSSLAASLNTTREALRA